MGWAKLDDRRHTNGKLIAVGLAANGLDVNAITYCAANETDGFIADNVLPVLAPMITGRQRRQLVDALVAVSRWTRDDDRGGWWVHDYLDYHPTREEQEKRRAGDRDRKTSGRKNVDRAASGRWESKRNPNGIPPDVQPDSGGSPPYPDPARPDPTQSRPPDPTNSPNGFSRKRASPAAAALAAESFEEFWEAYPRKESKPAAQRAFTAAAKRAEAPVIVEAARRFAKDPNLPDRKFIPHPSTWLANDRWNDPPLPATTRNGNGNGNGNGHHAGKDTGKMAVLNRLRGGQ